MDRWTWGNEVVQNIIALGIVSVYLGLLWRMVEIPVHLIGFVGAVLFYFGFKTYKKGTKPGS